MDTALERSPLAPALPVPSVVTRPFWEGCARGEFRLQACIECGHVTWYPRSVCPRCYGNQMQWQPADGRGTLVTYTKVHRGPGPDWQSLCPYVVAVVKLVEGPPVTTRLVDWQDADLRPGTPVRVVFLSTGTDLGIPVFRPDRAAAP